MKTCWIAAALLSLAAACGVGTQACSSLPGAKSGPTAAPGAAPPVAPGSAPGLLTPAAEVTLAHSADLSGFVPLLSLPELSVAAQAYGVEDYATCAALVDTYVRGNQFSVLEEPRWYLLLGSLREKAGDLLGASQAYERAAQSAWPLADYAALGLGRSLAGLADFAGAERALGLVPENAGTYPNARALLAELACRQGWTVECLERAQVFRALPRKPLSWSGQAWRIAELLVNQLAPGAPRPGAAVARSDAGASGAPGASAPAGPAPAPAPAAANAAVANAAAPSAAAPSPVATSAAPAPGDSAAPVPAPGPEDVLGALAYLRALIIDAPKTSSRYDAAGLERRLISALPVALQAKERQLSPQERLARAEAFGNAGRSEDAIAWVDALLAELGSDAYGPVACQARLVQGKALLELKQRSNAEKRFADIIGHCKSPDLRTSALFLAGRAAFQDDRYADADRLLERLEREAPRHRLADDARLYRAQVQRALGSDARFVALIDSMPKDYPEGDMVSDGLFALALSRMEKADWAGVARALGRSLELSGPDGAARGPETSGRERYFQARALIETGQVERGLSEYERIIAELPLSYYMLQAYSRLAERDAARGKRALDGVLQLTGVPPFEIEHRPEFDQPGFLRALELFRQSDIDSARRELELMNLLEPGTSPSVLWGVALLYARAGSARLSHALPRWQLHDWLERWPVGPWKQAWELAFPRPHIESVTEGAAQQGVDPALVYAVMREESAFDPEAVSPANAYGLMQVISPTARRFGKEAGLPYDRRALTTPRVNIAIGIRVLSNYQSRFPSDPLLAIPGYNAGPGKPKSWAKEWPSVDFDVWVELIPYRETRRYTKRVLASRGAYTFLYYQPADPSPGNDPLRLPRRLSPSAQE